MIEDNTNEGDLIFDPCAGGLTTVQAALDLNREFICCELDKDFYQKGKEFIINNYPSSKIEWSD